MSGTKRGHLTAAGENVLILGRRGPRGYGGEDGTCKDLTGPSGQLSRQHSGAGRSSTSPAGRESCHETRPPRESLQGAARIKALAQGKQDAGDGRGAGLRDGGAEQLQSREDEQRTPQGT